MSTASRAIRIKPPTLSKLKSLAEELGASLPDTVERAVDRLYREQWLAGLASDYARLRADQGAWAEELKERTLWDRALS